MLLWRTVLWSRQLEVSSSKFSSIIDDILPAHVAFVTTPIQAQPSYNELFFIILNTGNFFSFPRVALLFCDPNCWRTQKLKKNPVKRKLWMKHLANTRSLAAARLCSKIVPGRRNLHAWKLEQLGRWKTNYLSWHLNVCNSFRRMGCCCWRQNMGTLTGDEFSSSIILRFKFEAGFELIIYAAGKNVIKHGFGFVCNMRGRSANARCFDKQFVMHMWNFKCCWMFKGKSLARSLAMMMQTATTSRHENEKRKNIYKS